MSVVSRLSLTIVFTLVAIGVFVPFSAHAETIRIGMGPNYFTLPNVTINVGDTIIWTNTDTRAHTVTFGDQDSGTLQPGATYARVFNSVGTFSYQCIFHSGMTGTVTVKTPTATTPTTPTVQVTQSTSPSTVSALQAQVQALLSQITNIQSKLGLSTSSSSGSCPALSRSLKLGMEGSDVTALQRFLASDPSVYPEGKVTGYYGALTQSAVQRWQAKNGIVSSGTPSTTGYGTVGPRTIAAIASKCSMGGMSMPSTPVQPSDDLGAFMKITPITGFAPLASVIQVTVNTNSSCLAAIYTLDFGDGSSVPIPAAQGVCQPQSVTIQHTFQYAGVYQVKLSAGDHISYAVVSVSGQAAPNATPANTANQVNIQMLDSTFSPATLTVSPGTIVVWKNASNLAHTVTSDTGVFDSGTLQPTQTYALRFQDVGEFPYYCKFHGVPGGRGGMAGKIIVSGSATTNQSSNTSTNSTSQFTLTKSGLQVTMAFTTKGTCDSYSADWGDDSSGVYRFGDGSTCSNPESVTLKHTFDKAGTYIVTLRKGAALLDSTEKEVTVP